jgi:hypothetical protein
MAVPQTITGALSSAAGMQLSAFDTQLSCQVSRLVFVPHVSLCAMMQVHHAATTAYSNRSATVAAV